MKAKLICYFILLIFFTCAKIFGQEDSLKGYSGFDFGVAKDEIEEILEKKNIPFYTSWQYSTPMYSENRICYDEDVRLGAMNSHHYVMLIFDDNNKFACAYVLFTDRVSYRIFKSLVQRQFNKILDIMCEKYGTNFEMIDYSDSTSIFVGKRKVYNWVKQNGKIGMIVPFQNLMDQKG